MDRITYPTVLRECRRLIHDDMDASEVADALYKRGVPTENVSQHIYNYLVASWDATPDWGDPAFMTIVEAVVNPTDVKVAGFEAAKAAYDLLEYPEQDLLKFKGVERLSEKTIAQISSTPLDQVKRDATLAKDTFWKLFTRDRWSTLAYFFEELCEEVDASSSEILKVEAEHLAAKAAYNSLNETDKDVLKQRCVQGLSISEIAAKWQTSPVEISEILTAARAQFYDNFSVEIYRRWVVGDLIIKTDEGSTDKFKIVKTNKIKVEAGGEDDVSDAWKKLYERFYKFVPSNFRGWLSISAESSKHDAGKKEEHHGRIAAEYGRIYTNSEGEFVTVVSTTAEPLQPHEEWEKEKAEKKELRFWESQRKRWHQLLTKTATAISMSKKPEKKLFLLINYILQPKLNELRTTKPSAVYEYQFPGEGIALAHVLDQYQSKATQIGIGEVIDATDRSIRRYTDEIIRLVKRYAKEVGIEGAELVESCAPIKGWEAKKKSR